MVLLIYGVKPYINKTSYNLEVISIPEVVVGIDIDRYKYITYLHVAKLHPYIYI